MKNVSASLLVAVCLQLCRIVVTARLLPLNISTQLLSLLEANSNTNIRLPSSISNLTHPNYPVEDPFTMRSDNLDQRLRFYHFKDPLPPQDFSNMLDLAVAAALTKDPKSFLETQQLLFRSGNVQLAFYPRKYMTWEMWKSALRTMNRFLVEKSMAFGWSFLVMQEGLGPVGHGTVMDVSEQRMGLSTKR